MHILHLTENDPITLLTLAYRLTLRAQLSQGLPTRRQRRQMHVPALTLPFSSGRVTPSRACDSTTTFSFGL